MLQLVVPGEIHGAIAGHHLVEDPQVSGDTLRQQAVGPGYEVELSSRRTLVFQVVQQRTVVRQVGNIKSDPGGDLGLEMCFSLEDPHRRTQESQGVATDENHQRVYESVGLDQRPIQVDTKRSLRM